MVTDPQTVNLAGLIDLHIHSAPDLRPRLADDIDTARAAAAAGLRAILLKSHDTLTADRAALAEKAAGGVRVFGGLALNEAVGGLNPRAVEVALALGARQIWLPTFDAAACRRRQGRPGGLSVLAEDGSILPVVYEILDRVRDGDVMLGTGHLSVAEIVEVVRLARQRGLRKIVVTHPHSPLVEMPLAIQQEIAGEGVFFERCYLDTLPGQEGRVSLAEVADHIRRVGVQSTVLSTDLGQAGNPPPVDGLRRYLAGLMGEGFTEGEMRRMAGETPAYLLGL